MKINKSFILFALFLSSLQARVENVEFVAKEVHKEGSIVTATGDVLVYSPSYLISAKRAKYDEKNEIVELFENAMLGVKKPVLRVLSVLKPKYGK